ncbi:MAG: RNA polymerase sigma factor [Gemmataceae bacterium]
MNRLLLHLHRRIADVADADDSQLLAAFAGRRDADAFALLVRRHGPMVHGVCRRWLREPADVDDAFQATFLVLVRRAGSISRPHKLGNWLHGVALRTARNLRTRVLRQQFRRQTNFDLGVVPTSGHIADDETGPLLDEEIARLPELYRVPIVLCHLQGLTRRQAAAALGCPEGTLSARLSRGLSLLRHRLTRRGLGVAGVAALLTPRSADAVPPLLVRTTVQSALEFLSAAAPSRVAALAQGVLHMLFIRRLTASLAAVTVLLGLAAAAGLVLHNTAGTAAHAEAPAKSPEPVVVQITTDDAGALTRATVTEGGDDVSMITTHALARHLKRVRRDLPGAAVSLKVERPIRADVFEAVRKACTDAGFARLQLQSGDVPLVMYDVMPGPGDPDTQSAVKLGFFYLQRGLQNQNDGQAGTTAVAVTALLNAATNDPKQPLQGRWSVRQMASGNSMMTYNEGQNPREWIIVGDWLVTRDQDKYAVGRIRVEKAKDAQVIEFSYDANAPRHQMHRGTYTLTDNQLVITFPGSAVGWRGSTLPESITLERVKSAEQKP